MIFTSAHSISFFRGKVETIKRKCYNVAKDISKGASFHERIFEAGKGGVSAFFCFVYCAWNYFFVVWKGGVIDVIGTLLSVAMIIVGIIYLGSFILSLATFGASTIVGILVLAVGIWFLIQPSLIVSLVPVILGVGLVFHGIRAVTEAVNAKKYGYEKVGHGSCICYHLSGLRSGLCFLSAYRIEKQFIMLVGIVLIINGALNLWIAVTATRAARDYRRRTETVDTEFVENEGDRDETDGI